MKKKKKKKDNRGARASTMKRICPQRRLRDG